MKDAPPPEEEQFGLTNGQRRRLLKRAKEDFLSTFEEWQGGSHPYIVITGCNQDFAYPGINKKRVPSNGSASRCHQFLPIVLRGYREVRAQDFDQLDEELRGVVECFSSLEKIFATFCQALDRQSRAFSVARHVTNEEFIASVIRPRQRSSYVEVHESEYVGTGVAWSLRRALLWVAVGKS